MHSSVTFQNIYCSLHLPCLQGIEYFLYPLFNFICVGFLPSVLIWKLVALSLYSILHMFQPLEFLCFLDNNHSDFLNQLHHKPQWSFLFIDTTVSFSWVNPTQLGLLLCPIPFICVGALTCRTSLWQYLFHSERCTNFSVLRFL